MQVDWLTVIAQIINFLILIVLLKRFLYRPIVSTMEARQRYIESQLQQARELKRQGEQLIATYRDRLNALEKDRQRLLDQAKQAAESEREALLEKIRIEVEQKRLQWQQDLAREQASLLRELKILLAEQLVDLGRKAFADLAAKNLEQCIIDRFVEKLNTLAAEQLCLLRNSSSCLVSTSFPLRSEDKARIEQALGKINPSMTISYECKPDLICGISVETGDRIWHWNLASYLDEFEVTLSKVIPG